MVTPSWCGRAGPTAGARADQTGREAAAPLLFDVFDQLQAPSQIPQAIAPKNAPSALQALDTPETHASILFPPSGATVYVETSGTDAAGNLRLTRPLKLSARALRPVSWYIDGEPLLTDATGDFSWYPKTEGFYDLTLIDAKGNSAKSHVRVLAIKDRP
ncbi:MAG: hypothetical protein WDN06_03515 [Asticcacaulis sp.]